MIETDKVNKLICEHKINPTQVYILWLLYSKDATNIENYIKVFGEFKKEDFEDLIEKGLLLWTNREAESFITRDLIVTLEFAEEQVNPEDAYDELFSVYPSWLLVNDRKVPARGLNASDEKAAREAYSKEIKKNKFIHLKVLEAVNKDKELNNGYARVKIDKFISGKLWEAIGEDDDRGKIRIY